MWPPWGLSSQVSSETRGPEEAAKAPRGVWGRRPPAFNAGVSLGAPRPCLLRGPSGARALGRSAPRTLGRSDARTLTRPVTGTEGPARAGPGPDACCPHAAARPPGPRDGSVGGRSRPHGAGQTGPGSHGRFRNMLLAPQGHLCPQVPPARTHDFQRSKPPTSALLSRSRGPARPPRPLSSSIHGGAGRTGSRPGRHPQSQQRRSPLVTHSIERRSRKFPDRSLEGREWGPAEDSDPMSGAFRARLARSPGPGMQQS